MKDNLVILSNIICKNFIGFNFLNNLMNISTYFILHEKYLEANFSNNFFKQNFEYFWRTTSNVSTSYPWYHITTIL